MKRVGSDQLRVGLGLLWIFDGLLQLQPFMLGPRFFPEVLGMVNMGLPAPLAALEWRVTHFSTAHPLSCDLALALVQIGLGAGIVAAKTRKAALALSIPWGLAVWVVGEGMGGLFMPGTSMLTGAPGPVLLYVVAAVVLWPADPAPRRRPHVGRGGGVKAGGVGPAGSVLAWAALWLVGALLELASANHAAGVPAAEIGDGLSDQPFPLAVLDHFIAWTVGHRGMTFAVAAAFVETAVGLFALSPRLRPAALWAGAGISALYWVAGQHLGDLFSGHATDPGAGPLWILLALIVWDSSASHRGPAGQLWTASPVGGVVMTARGFEEQTVAPVGRYMALSMRRMTPKGRS